MTKNQGKKGKNFLSLLKNKKKQNFQFFIKNRGLTLKEKCQIFDFLKSTFFWFKMDSFLARTSQNTLFRNFWLEKKGKKFQIFQQKTGKKG